jgi:hypothetical protein
MLIVWPVGLAMWVFPRMGWGDVDVHDLDADLGAEYETSEGSGGVSSGGWRDVWTRGDSEEGSGE